MRFFALDFEASGLDLKRSYPIEVGYTDGDGIAVSMLIKPAADWTYWNEDSQVIHGIDRELLDREGHDISYVVHKLNNDLAGHSVVVDGGDYDLFWLNRLYAASMLMPTFRLQNIAVPRFKDVQHRALPDAVQLWHWIDQNVR